MPPPHCHRCPDLLKDLWRAHAKGERPRPTRGEDVIPSCYAVATAGENIEHWMDLCTRSGRVDVRRHKDLELAVRELADQAQQLGEWIKERIEEEQR